MASKGGKREGSGRPKGSPNKFNKQFKDLLTETYLALEAKKDHGLQNWAEKHPTDFYRICSKLVPQEMVGDFTGEVTIRVIRDGANC